MKFLAVFLLSCCAALGQLLPISSLPLTDPAIPTAPTASSSNNDKLRWLWGNYYYQQTQTDRTTILSLKTQVAVLTGQLATATQSGSAVLSKLDTIDAKINSLTSSAAFIASQLPTAANVHVTFGSSQALVAWDYNFPTTNVSGFRVERSLNGIDFTLLATVLVTQPFVYADKSVTAGVTYWYRVKAYSLVLARESSYSDVATFVPNTP